MSSEARWLIAELVATVALPAVALIWLTDDDWLGPVIGLVVALLPPAIWAVLSMVRERRVSPLAVIALVSVSLTGGVGLLELDPRWFAIKEAAVPAGLGLAAIASAPTRYSVVPILMDRIVDPDKLRAVSGASDALRQSGRVATIRAGVIMIVTAGGTWVLARAIVQSAPGTEAFGGELGRFTGLSFPVLGIPSSLATLWVLMRVVYAVEGATGARFEDLMRSTTDASSA